MRMVAGSVELGRGRGVVGFNEARKVVDWRGRCCSVITIARDGDGSGTAGRTGAPATRRWSWPAEMGPTVGHSPEGIGAHALHRGEVLGLGGGGPRGRAEHEVGKRFRQQVGVEPVAADRGQDLRRRLGGGGSQPAKESG